MASSGEEEEVSQSHETAHKASDQRIECKQVFWSVLYLEEASSLMRARKDQAERLRRGAKGSERWKRKMSHNFQNLGGT